MKHKQGLFITFEGCEGCGKSTQSHLLYESLQRLQVPAILTQEPGGTRLGNRIRNLLKVKRNIDISAKTELFLFAACRAQLITEVIKPALAANKVIICDRFMDSTTVYQGFGRGLDFTMIKQVNSAAIDGIKPDLTILLDVPPDKGLSRKTQSQNDRFETEKLDFHLAIRNGYLALAKQEPERWVVMEGIQPVSEIQNSIWDRIKPLLSERNLLTDGC